MNMQLDLFGDLENNNEVNNGKIERMTDLVNEINYYNYNYYDLDVSLISDKEWDVLYDELLALESELGTKLDNSPTIKIGGKASSKFKKHTHLSKLWSLDKAQTTQELKDWHLRCVKAIEDYNTKNPNNPLPLDFEMSLERKFDGLTVNVTYKNGEFSLAATRGTGGITGEVITEQIKTITTDFPSSIPFNETLEIQAEGIMKISNFVNYNASVSDENKKLKNPRNGAAGALRNLDPKVTATRNLNLMFYNIGHNEGVSFTNSKEYMNFLKQNNFNVDNYFKTFTKIEDIIVELEKASIERETLDFLIDGMVVKITDLRIREALGYTEKFPRWAIAYKFYAEEYITTLKDVIVEVGRTGRINPTAKTEVVEMNGATVSSFTLNNYNDIDFKGLKHAIGAKIKVRKSNDVIPEILGLADEHKGLIFGEIIKPTHCPSCNSELVEEGSFLFCLNETQCPQQLIKSIQYFGCKEAMNIEGFSIRTAEQLFNNLKVKDISHLYSLSVEDLLTLDGFKDKKAQNLYNSIQATKNCTLDKFIIAMGIDNIGPNSAKLLAKKFETLENLMNAKAEDIITINSFGDITTQCVVDFFSKEKNKEIIKHLIDLGINISYEKIEISNDSIFSGKTVVVTGTIEGWERKALEAKLETLGAKITSSVSKKTNMVVFGENAGTKLSKAQKLNDEGLSIILMDVEELLKNI